MTRNQATLLSVLIVLGCVFGCKRQTPLTHDRALAAVQAKLDAANEADRLANATLSESDRKLLGIERRALKVDRISLSGDGTTAIVEVEVVSKHAERLLDSPPNHVFFDLRRFDDGWRMEGYGRQQSEHLPTDPRP